jgi:gas vesicle protein
MVIKKEIEQSQYQLNLVNTEIREIHQWFQELHAQKQSFYEQIVKKSTDMSGNITSHFQRKSDNIKKYIAAMQEQAQIHIKDV